jgi:hypothetical protein
MALDDLLPAYDIHDEVAVTVAAPPGAVYDALMEVDLIDVGRRRPLVGVLGGLRMVPDVVARLVRGEPQPAMPQTLRLRDLANQPAAEGGWSLLAEEPGAWIALGLVGRFWKPVIEYADVPAERFAAFDEPGWAKTMYALGVRPLPDGRTLLTGAMRTATTDERARRWFRRYWTLGVGPGAHEVVWGLLECVREDAEARASGADQTSAGRPSESERASATRSRQGSSRMTAASGEPGPPGKSVAGS